MHPVNWHFFFISQSILHKEKHQSVNFSFRHRLNICFSMILTPQMGKFEGRYSLIACTFFFYCPCFMIAVELTPTKHTYFGLIYLRTDSYIDKIPHCILNCCMLRMQVHQKTEKMKKHFFEILKIYIYFLHKHHNI